MVQALGAAGSLGRPLWTLNLNLDDAVVAHSLGGLEILQPGLEGLDLLLESLGVVTDRAQDSLLESHRLAALATGRGWEHGVDDGHWTLAWIVFANNGAEGDDVTIPVGSVVELIKVDALEICAGALGRLVGSESATELGFLCLMLLVIELLLKLFGHGPFLLSLSLQLLELLLLLLLLLLLH